MHHILRAFGRVECRVLALQTVAAVTMGRNRFDGMVRMGSGSHGSRTSSIGKVAGVFNFAIAGFVALFGIPPIGLLQLHHCHAAFCPCPVCAACTGCVESRRAQHKVVGRCFICVAEIGSRRFVAAICPRHTILVRKKHTGNACSFLFA